MSDYQDSSYKIDAHFQNHIEQRTNDYGAWYQGYVVTIHGVVAVQYSDADSTCLEFAHDGRVYRRFFRQGFALRRLVTLAKRFAADVRANA